MALGKSNDAGVRSFAATLINHHAAAATTLQHMLHVRAMAAPMLDNAQRKTLNRLAKLHGRKFDREFMDEVALKYQLQDVEQYEKAGLTIKDPALTAWIASTLPTLRYHLAIAERSTPIEVKQASAPAPAKVAAPRSVRPAGVHTVAGKRLAPRPELATRSMGAGPAKQGHLTAHGPRSASATSSLFSAPPISATGRRH